MSHILVVGGGRLVYFVCRALIAKGHTVTVINRRQAECVWLARRLRALVVHGDGSRPQTLEEAGAGSADAVLAVTPNDEDNLVICQLAAVRFGVPRTLASVSDPDHEEVFAQLGVTAVATTRILASLIEQRIGFDQIVNLLPVGEGKANVTEVTLTDQCPVVGQSLSQVPLPADSLVALILRRGEAVVPRGPTVLERGDRLIVITLPANHGQVIRMLTGETKE